MQPISEHDPLLCIPAGATLEYVVRPDGTRLRTVHAGQGPTVVLLCGEMDRTCPRWHSERLGKELPNAHNVWLPRVGHMLCYEAPQAILDALQRAP
jgi:pimeloyl-ACP methyl ester carboxylesterase